MHKLTGVSEFAEAHKLTKDEALEKLQKLVPPCLLTFEDGYIVKDYNTLGICWQLYRPLLEKLDGIPDNREMLYLSTLGFKGALDSVVLWMLYNQNVEARLRKLPKEKKVTGVSCKLLLCELPNYPIRVYAYADGCTEPFVYELVEGFDEEVL